MPDKHPGGRPPTYDSGFHPLDYINQSTDGKSLTQIAASWSVARETIYQWVKTHEEFSDAVSRGRDLVEAWYANLGQQGMQGLAKVEWSGFKWMSQNICKWRHNVSQEVTGAQGGPIKYKSMTEEELRAEAANLANEISRGLSREDKDAGPDSG